MLSSIKPKNISIFSITTAISFVATHFVSEIANDDDGIVFTSLTLPIIMHAVRTPEYRWYAFRAIDGETGDNENSSVPAAALFVSHRPLIAIGAFLAENSLAFVPSLFLHAGLLCVPMLSLTKNDNSNTPSTALMKVINAPRTVVETVLMPMLNRSSSMLMATGIWNLSSPNSIEQKEKVDESEEGSANNNNNNKNKNTRVTFKLLLCGLCSGALLYKSTVALRPSSGVYSSICLPTFRAFLNSVAPSMPSSSFVDRIGALTIAAGLTTVGVGYCSLVLENMSTTKPDGAFAKLTKDVVSFLKDELFSSTA